MNASLYLLLFGGPPPGDLLPPDFVWVALEGASGWIAFEGAPGWSALP